MRLQDPTAAASASPSVTGGPQQTLLSAAWGSLGQSSSGGGVGALVQALRAAVSAGLSAGKDVADKLAQSLDNGLQKAEQTLVSQGMDARQAANRVATFRRELARAVEGAAVQAAGQGAATSGAGTASPGGSASPVGGANGSVTAAASTNGSVSPASTANGSASSAAPASGNSAGSFPQGGAGSAGALGVAGAISVREALQVVMTDGTRVTVRFSEQDLFAAGIAQSADGSGSTLAAAVSRGRVQIAVRGSLSAGDLQALDALASQVDVLAQQFFSGDVQDAFNSAAALGADPSEIAQFSLQLSYEQIGTVSSAGSSASPVSGSVAGQSAAPAQSISGGTSTSAPASTPAFSSAAAPAAGSAPAGSAPAVGSAPTAGSAPAQPAPGSAQIANFIQDVLGKLGSVSATKRLNFSMKWQLELLAAALPAYAPGAQSAPAAGTQLAASTLRSLTG